MNSNDFTSAERIIADAVATVNDVDFKNGFSLGWYKSHVQKALTELSIETKWLKEIKDFDVPSNLQIEIPSGVYDVREIYLYNGERCNPQGTQVVHWKRTFNNMYRGDGYTARIKDDGSNSGDIFLPNQRYDNNKFKGYSGSKYYYNVYQGTIMLSTDCASFSYLRVIFNSFGGEIGDEPIIPRFFERAISDYLEERFYNAMKARNPRTYRSLWSDADNRLNSSTGSWAKARRRIKEMDKAERESLNEYLSSMYHK